MGGVLVLREGQLVPVRVDQGGVRFVVEDGLQLLAHLGRAGVALPGFISAGLPHDLPQAPLPIKGLWNRLPAHPLGQGQLAAVEGDGLRGRGQEGHPVLVQQPVEDDAQGVDVHAKAVLGPPVDLGGHIAVGPLLGQPGGGLFNGSGDAEVPQLEVPVVGHEDVLRLDVPVDDIVLLAELQSPAQVDAQADNVPPGKGVLIGVRQQRVEQFHPDQDVPADPLRMADHRVVLVTHHVGRPLEPGHNGELPDDILHHAVEILFRLGLGHALLQHGLQLLPALGDRDHLQRRPVNFPEILALDLIDGAEAAPPDLPCNHPAAEDQGALPVLCCSFLFLYHGNPFLHRRVAGRRSV